MGEDICLWFIENFGLMVDVLSYLWYVMELDWRVFVDVLLVLECCGVWDLLYGGWDEVFGEFGRCCGVVGLFFLSCFIIGCFVGCGIVNYFIKSICFLD